MLVLTLDPEACAICDQFDCACETFKAHATGCVYLLAATCPIPFPCDDHGLDVCPECYACTCGATKLSAPPPEVDDGTFGWRCHPCRTEVRGPMSFEEATLAMLTHQHEVKPCR